VKTWKVVQIVGVLVLLLGVIIRVGTGDYAGTGIAVLGVIVYAVGRVATWLKSDRP
jgi:hypothetical protein